MTAADEVCHCGLGPEDHKYPGAAEHSYTPQTPPRESDEDAFHRAIAEDPADTAPYQVFADWLEERGDPRAEGYRALGVLGKQAEVSGNGNLHDDFPGPDVYEWWSPGASEAHGDTLPLDWFGLIETSWVYHGAGGIVASKDFAGRREANDAAALAFSRLPPDRRAELLKGKT